mmetsp:Transcript_18938/g.56445  ORF Transcript_18938/g.56445 Transcript_18938/m.56445 type:complete len:247 (+) Transcript_18938:691-1431(+)
MGGCLQRHTQKQNVYCGGGLCGGGQWAVLAPARAQLPRRRLVQRCAPACKGLYQRKRHAWAPRCGGRRRQDGARLRIHGAVGKDGGVCALAVPQGALAHPTQAVRRQHPARPFQPLHRKHAAAILHGQQDGAHGCQGHGPGQAPVVGLDRARNTQGIWHVAVGAAARHAPGRLHDWRQNPRLRAVRRAAGPPPAKGQGRDTGAHTEWHRAPGRYICCRRLRHLLHGLRKIVRLLHGRREGAPGPAV